MQDISFSVWAGSERSLGGASSRGNQSRWLSAHTLDRRLCIFSRYVGAVLTASLSPAAPILSIENEVRAFRNLNAVPRGFLELSLAVLSPRDFLSTPPILARIGSRWELPGGKRKRSCVHFFFDGGRIMLSDDEIIEVISKRMSCEVGWSEASKVFNHYGFVDVVTFLYSEPTLQPALLAYYAPEIEEALQTKVLAPQLMELREDYKEWKADVATRGGT